jgi:hypothetical protein
MGILVLLPSLHAHRAWRGGVGGSAAFTEAEVPADRPPTPDPSPPLRGGRGEETMSFLSEDEVEFEPIGFMESIH